MPLENRLQRKTLGTPNDTYRDDMQASKNTNPLEDMLKVGIAGAGLYGLYKKGMLKPIIKGFVEVSEKIASDSLDKTYLTTEAIKKWTNINNLAPEVLEDMGIKIPDYSLFRGSNLSKLKEVGGTIKDGIQSHSLNLNLAKRIINDTAYDMDILKQMINENQGTLENLRRTFYNTDLVSGIKEVRKFSREVMANSPEVQIMAKSKAAQTFVDNNILTREKELEMLKNNGFRPIMLQDIIKTPTKNADGATILETLENAPIDLYDGLPQQSGHSMIYLQGIIDNPDYRYLRNGKPTSMLGDWDNVKRLVVDQNLLMNEQGKPLDLRMTDKIKSNFLKSLSTDFKIPGLNFNPLATLFPSWAKGDIKPSTLGILSKDSIQPFITKQAGNVTLNDTIGSDMLVFNGEGFKVVDNQLEKVADGIKLHDISRAGQFGFNKTIDSTRKIAGLEYYEYALKDNKFAQASDNFFKTMDMGRPDVFDKKKSRFNADGTRFTNIDIAKDFNDYTNFESVISDKMKDTFGKLNPYDLDNKLLEKNAADVFGAGPAKIQKEFSSEDSRKFIATIKGMTFSDIKEQQGITNKIDYTKNYISQAFAGRNKDSTMSDNFTESSLRLYGLFDNVFERLGDIAPQLAFSTESKGNLADYLKNVALKRVLPIYGVTQIPEMLNMLSEPIFNLLGANKEDDGTDNRMNISKFVTSEIVKPIDIGFHSVKDTLGITKIMKEVEEFTPGFDQINELPGIYNLGIAQTKQERLDYIESGMDPVRKGRYWGMGNTPFTGGKIMYWRPNTYRRVAADVDFSDSKWGSRQEYYNNTWFPNPVNPLAPLNHFVFNKDYYDKKHYYDRPYLLTSSKGTNIPIVGPIVGSTIGSVGQRRMHQEYWQDGQPIERDDESVSLIDDVNEATAYRRQTISNYGFINGAIITNINKNLQSSRAGDAQYRQGSIAMSKQMVGTPMGQNFVSYEGVTGKPLGSGVSAYEIYTTPSGGMQIVDIPDSLSLWDANQQLRNYSIKRMPEADSRVSINDNKYNPQIADYSNERINNHFIYGAGEQFNTLADLFGMKGFEMQAFVTGEANQNARTIEDSNYAYSFNKSFWDENLGGLGGEASEIFRRFVQKRNTSTEFINPVRNTMPSWMPGCFVAGTKVFTENKVNNIEDLQIGQKAYDHNGELQIIEYVHQGQYSGDMISIKAKGICNNITATGNHPFYVMTSNYCSYRKTKMCIPGIHPNNNKPCRYCKNKQWNSFEWREARELKEGDYLVIAIPKNNHSINELIIPNSSRKMVKDISGKHIPLDFNFGVFTGFYLSEGHADKYRITFGSGKCEPEQIESVKYIGNLLNLTTSSFDVYDENDIGCIVTNIHSKQISGLMKENFGHLSFNKTLPDWIFNAPIEYQMGIIAGMIQGDGSVGTKLSLTLTSVSYSLLQNTLLLLAQNNICSTIKSSTNNNGNIKYTLSISQRDAVTLKKLTHSYGTKISQIPDEYPKCTGCSSVIYNGYLLRKIDKIEKYNDTITVYNLQVANSHTYNVEGVSVHNSNYFTDFKHGDSYSKVPNGEERLPGEGYERLYDINTKKMFEFGIGSSFIGKSKEEIIKHFLNQDNISGHSLDVIETGNKMHEQIQDSWLEAGLAIDVEGKIEDKENNILGFYDAKIHDINSPTGVGIVDIKTVGQKKFDNIVETQNPLYEHQSQVNYYLWATGNTKSPGYIHYVNRDNPDQTLTLGFNFSQDLLNENLNNLAQARNTIMEQVQTGQIGRGELYDNLDRFRILADVAPYSDEYARLSAILSNDTQLSTKEREEISQIKDRVSQQKEPLRVYPYKFKTSNLQNEDVTVKKVIDNNTILVDRYGVEHAIKLAGVHVSQSNTDKYNKDTTMNDAASKELKKYLKKGKRITINYDADDANKFKKDSTESIRAVVYSQGKNVNRWMMNKGLAKENEDDNSPAGINARYTNNEKAIGSAMERITHSIAQMPFIGNKVLQVKSPYEQYRDKEVYGKDFQSWNKPIKDFLIPQIDKISATDGVGAVFLGGFIGSLFGKSRFGKIIGGATGVTIGAIGRANALANKTHDRDWVPDRRQKQSELNEYFDTLKYVKNMSLYEKYKKKAMLEDRVDVSKLEGSKLQGGIYNKNRVRELKDFKKTVKLDFKHRQGYDFKYGSPKYVDMQTDKSAIIKGINQELAEIQGDRTLEKASDNVINALSYKQMADKTMYGYKQGDPLNNLMSALPKKERQYFKYFMDAPEEEKDKILRIAPDYLRRGLQQAWGMDVDKKPTLNEYFSTHGLPDTDWIGWDEETNIENVKVKLVHNNKLDMGEFDLWDDQINSANQVDIPVPKIRSQNSNTMVQLKLRNILGKMGYEDLVVSQYQSGYGNRNTLNIYQDSRDDISNTMYSMNI